MDYKEFMKYMDHGGTSEKDAVSRLQNYVHEFPYFQTAHILFAKALKEQEHVRFDKQLKIAAAYSSDRRSLYAIINYKPTSIFAETISSSPFISAGSNTSIESANPFAGTETSQNSNEIIAENNSPAYFEPVVSHQSEDLNNFYLEDENESVAESGSEKEKATPNTQTSNEPQADPHAIIRQRLKEILGKKDDSPEEKNIPAEKAENIHDLRNESEIRKTEKAPAPSVVDEKIIPAEKAENIHDLKNELEIRSEENKPESIASPEIPTGSEVASIISSLENKNSSDEIKNAIAVTHNEIRSEPVSEFFIDDEEGEVEADPFTEGDRLVDESDPEIIIQKIAEESKSRNDEVDRGELEYALESTVIHSLEKLPLLEEPVAEETAQENIIQHEAPSDQPRSFYDWLREKQGSEYGKIIEVHAYEPTETGIFEHRAGGRNELESMSEGKEESQIQSASNSADLKPSGEPATVLSVMPESKAVAEKLIDKFIAAEPRIIPSKTEFYSPEKQARKSITEDEDLVSETLAKIYSHQGAHLKARSAYQKLILLHPEKKAYFAALIEEIDNQYNNPDKQDL